MSLYDETIFHIWRIFEKRCYYLMSAAGAGVGYTMVTIEADATPSETRLILASLLVWALSFFCGLGVIANLKAVVGMFSVTPRQLDESLKQGPEKHSNLIETIDNVSSHLGRRIKGYHVLQVATLGIAAALLALTKVNVAAALGITL